MINSDECRRRVEAAEALIKEGKTAFKGEVKVLEIDDLTIKAFVEDRVITQIFVCPVDLNRDVLTVLETVKKSGTFSDCVRMRHWILKVNLPAWQKQFGDYLKVEREEKTGTYVQLDVDLKGFRDAMSKLR